MVKRTLFLFFIIMLFSGCAAKSQFVYEHPDAKPDTPMASSVAVLTPVADHRTGDKKIDTIFKENPIASVQHVIQEELLDTGLFREVMTIDKMNSGTDIANDKADVVVYTELRKMEWFVPD